MRSLIQIFRKNINICENYQRIIRLKFPISYLLYPVFYLFMLVKLCASSRGSVLFSADESPGCLIGREMTFLIVAPVVSLYMNTQQRILHI